MFKFSTANLLHSTLHQPLLLLQSKLTISHLLPFHILHMHAQHVRVLLLEQRLSDPSIFSSIGHCRPRHQSIASRPSKPNRALGKDTIDILKLQAFGFGVEDEDDGDPKGVEDGEDDVGLPTDVLDGGRGDLDDEEVADPVAGGGDGGATLAELEGQDLGRVDPDSGLEADGEGALEDEEHGGGGLASEVGRGGVVLDLVDEGGLDGHDARHERDHGQ